MQIKDLLEDYVPAGSSPLPLLLTLRLSSAFLSALLLTDIYLYISVVSHLFPSFSCSIVLSLLQSIKKRKSKKRLETALNQFSAVISHFPACVLYIKRPLHVSTVRLCAYVCPYCGINLPGSPSFPSLPFPAPVRRSLSDDVQHLLHLHAHSGLQPAGTAYVHRGSAGQCHPLQVPVCTATLLIISFVPCCC